MMDFTLDEDQQVIARLAAEACASEDHWKALSQAGLLSLTLPEWLGGDGLSFLETAIVLTEVGRAGLASPALSTLTSVWAIVQSGDRALQEELLPEVAAGNMLLSNGGHYAAEAHRILVEKDGEIALIDPAAATLERVHTATGAPEYKVTGEPIRKVKSKIPAKAGAVAVADGAIAGALKLTTEHIGTRIQFGRPIATFQAAALQIADVYIASRTMHLASLAANWRLDDDDIEIAAYWLAKEGPKAVQICHHLHGGIGLDVTYPLHRYSSLVRDLVRYVH